MEKMSRFKINNLLYLVFIYFAFCSNISADFTEVYPALKNELWGYIDYKGNVVIPFKFKAAEKFCNGVARVSTENGVGFININGEFITSDTLGYSMDFSGGLITYTEKYPNKFIINMSGKPVIEPDIFNDMEFCYEIYKNIIHFRSLSALFEIFVDSTGREIFRINNFNKKISLISNDLIKTEQVAGGNIVTNFYNLKGDLEFTFNCETDDCFDNKIHCYPKNSDDYFFNIVDGSIIQYPKSKNTLAFNFKEGFAVIKNFELNKFGFIDSTGKIVIDFLYDYAESFNEKMAAVKIEQKWGFIDIKGNMVIAPKYKHVYRPGFIGKLAKIEIDRTTNAYIDRNGNLVWVNKFSLQDTSNIGF